MQLKHFKPSEFTMDGREVFDKMDPEFLLKMDTCRDLAGVPFKITSSFRTPAKNKAVGGADNSYHLKGRAVDVLCTDAIARHKIVAAAMQLGLSVGIMENGVHLDNRDGEPVLFHYYKNYTRK